MNVNISIGIDARFLLRPLRGIPLYVLRICEILPSLNRNYQFYYFINKGFEHNDNPDNYLPRLNEIEKNNSNVIIVNYDDDSEVKWEQIYLPNLIKKYKIDLLHMPSNRISFFTRVPTIITLHDVIEYKNLNINFLKNIFIESGNIRIFFYHLRMFAYIWANYKFGIHRASHIITVSKYSAMEINQTLNIQKRKITSIYHGLDDDFIVKSEAGSDINGYELHSRNFVLMLGGDSHHKNPEGAIASWAKVPEPIRRKFPLKIIGFLGGGNSPLLTALNDFNLRDQVEIKGWVTREELIDHMRSAALFIYLSRYEGFGFPPLHAMASGTPVVASNRTSIPEILDNVGYKFDPADHEGVAKEIVTLLSDAALWKEQSDAGIIRSRMFSWAISSHDHLNVYQRVIEDFINGYSL